MTESPNHDALDAHVSLKGLHVPHSAQDLAEETTLVLHAVEDKLPPKLRGHSRWWWLAHAMIVPVLLLVLLMLWLGTGVRNVDAMRPFLESELCAQTKPFMVQVGALDMTLDTKKWHLIADLKRLNVRSDSGKRIAQFPAIRLTLKWPALLSGHVKVKELGIISPLLRVQRDAQGALSLNLAPQEEDAQQEPSQPLQLGDMVMGIRSLGLDRIGLYNGSIALGAGGDAVLWHTPSAVISFRGDNPRALKIGYDVTLSDGTREAALVGQAQMMTDGSVTSALTIKDFPLYTLAPLHAQFKVFEAMKVHLTGAADVVITAKGQVQNFNFAITSGDGVLEDKHFFPDAVTLHEVKLQGKATNDLKDINIDEVVLKLGEGATLRGAAKLQMVDATPTSPAGMVVNANAQAYRVQVADVKRYWPATLAPMSRAWVVENLTSGIIPRGEIIIALTPEDLQQRPLPDRFLKAAVQVEGATVRYLPHMPEVTGVSGVVSFTGHSMTVDAQTGKTLTNSVLRKGRVAIPDFFDEARGIPMTVDLDVDTVAPDVAEVLSKDRLNLGASLKLDPKRVQGTGKGTVHLQFPLYSHALPPELQHHTDYAIKATMDGVSQDNILDKWNIKGLKGTFEADNTQLKLAGTLILNGLDTQLVVHDVYGDNAQTHYQLKTTASVPQLAMFGVKDIPYLSGVVGFDADVVEKKGQKPISKVQADLTNAAFEIPILMWKKPVGVEASGKLTHTEMDSADNITDMLLKTSGLYLQGDMLVSKATKDIVALRLKELRYGRSDVALDYAVDAQGVRSITLRGANADATPWVGDEAFDNESSDKAAPSQPREDAIAKLVNMDVDVQVARLEMGKERAFQPFSAQLNCRQICTYVNAHGKTKTGNDVDWQIRSTGSARSLRAMSNNTGEAAHILGITKHMKGGVFALEGKFDDTTPEHAFNGKMLITDFSMVNGPVLTRLLSLMSLTGMVNALSGNGIEFKKAEGDVQYTADKLQLKDVRSHGSALGLTLSGVIAPFGATMALEGTLVPAYSANSILGNIPVLGTLLTGGEGGGIFAANFSLKGNSGDPSVMVNPLSLLTPGFLRRIFDIAD